jgi:hypothetical protein
MLFNEALSLDGWGAKIAGAYAHHKIDELSPSAAQEQFLTKLYSWKYYSYSLIHVQQKRDPTDVWLAINKDRVALLNGPLVLF